MLYFQSKQLKCIISILMLVFSRFNFKMLSDHSFFILTNKGREYEHWRAGVISFQVTSYLMCGRMPEYDTIPTITITRS